VYEARVAATNDHGNSGFRGEPFTFRTLGTYGKSQVSYDQWASIKPFSSFADVLDDQGSVEDMDMNALGKQARDITHKK